jgi:radical SAM protein with 4Fe4S-binding SPASM domain
MTNKKSKLNNYMNVNPDNPFSSQTKMLFHLDKVNEYLQTGNTFPVLAEIMPANSCDLACYFCITENRLDNKDNAKAMLKREPTLQFIRDFKRLGGKAINFSGGGSPELNPHFKDFVLETTKNGLDCGLLSHGAWKEKLTTVIGENCKWVRISLDTINHEKYLAWKGKDYIDRILKNIEDLKKYPIKVGVNVNVNNDMTIEETQELIDVCYPNVNYIQFRPVLNRYYKPNEHIQINEEVWDYLKQYEKNEKISLSYDKLKGLKGNQFPFSKCTGHQFEPVLEACGSVKVCSYFSGDDRFSFGNINDNSLEDIWKSQQRQDVIKFVEEDLNYGRDCQISCKCSTINQFIDFIANPPPDSLDVNFL